MKPNPLPFLREKWNGVPPPTTSFDTKTIIITGANVGLGLEAAVIFTNLNAAKVILAVRNTTKGNAAKQKVEDRTGRKGVVEVWELDMDRFASIESFAKRVEQDLPRLDVAVLNAGASPKDYALTAEGYETILQVNAIGTALLGLLLLPKLKASKISEQDLPHLVIVTSESHRWVEEKDFPDTTPYGGNLLLAVNAAPKGNEKFNWTLQGPRTKLFTHYVANELANLMRKSSGEIESVVVSVCPGATKSDLMRDLGGFPFNIVMKIFDILFNKTTEEGARVYIAASVLGPEAHGAWYKTTALTT